MSNRREFIKALLIAGSTSVVTRRAFGATVAELSHRAFPSSLPKRSAWAQVPEILKRIKTPVFPRRDFDITRYGASGDGKADCTTAFREAVTACNKAGGGRVVVPVGSFLTGPI